jgi:hypothetical protein
MNLEKEVLEQKAKIRMLEYKIQALQNLLNNEGIIVDDELETEIKSVMNEEKE